MAINKHLLLLLLCSQGSMVFSRVLTFEEAVNIALGQSYAIKSFEQDRLSTEYHYQFYKAQFKPRIDVGFHLPAWNESVSAIEQPDGLPVYNSTGSLQYSGDLAFTYMLPTGGHFQLSSMLYRDDISTSLESMDYETFTNRIAYSRMALSFSQPFLTTNRLKENLREAKYYNEKARHRFTRGQMDIIYDVTRGFYALYRATRLVEITYEKFENAQDFYRIAQIKAQNGRIPEVDVLLAKVTMAQSQADLSESQNALEREKDNLKNLIGLSLDEDIQILTDLKYDTFNVDMDKAIQAALKNRLELQESDLDIALQKIEVDRAKRVREISGEISAYYDFTGVSTLDSRNTRDLFESSFDNFLERKPNRGVTITLSYPIWDWGRGSARVQEQKVNLKNRMLDAAHLRQEIMREVRDVVRSVGEARNRLQIYEQNREVAEMTYNIYKMRFENGGINSQELATEQERLQSSQLSYLNAYITYQLAVAELKRKTLWNFEEDRSYLEEVGNNDQ